MYTCRLTGGHHGSRSGRGSGQNRSLDGPCGPPFFGSRHVCPTADKGHVYIPYTARPHSRSIAIPGASTYEGASA